MTRFQTHMIALVGIEAINKEMRKQDQVELTDQAMSALTTIIAWVVAVEHKAVSE